MTNALVCESVFRTFPFDRLGAIEAILVGLIGSHIPKSSTLFFVLLAVLAWRCRKIRPVRFGLRWSVVCIFAFSIGYVIISVHHGLWSLSGRDLLDVVSLLVLPSASVWIGAKAGAHYSARSMAIALASYSICALAYSLITLVYSRVFVQELGLLGLLPSSYPVHSLFSLDKLINVRSIEQNASFAAAFLPLSILSIRKGQSVARSIFLCFIALLGLVGILVGIAFSGRLVILSALISWFFLFIAWPPVRYFAQHTMQKKFNVIAATVCFSVGAILFSLVSPRQYVYDERIDRYKGFASSFLMYPNGGNRMRFRWLDSVTGEVVMYDALGGGSDSSSLMHNVIMDVFVRVGWFPASMLCLGIAPLLLFAVRNLVAGYVSNASFIVLSVASAFLVCWAVQFLFQPLIYSDGLLFYFGLLLLGFLSTCGFDRAARPGSATLGEVP